MKTETQILTAALYKVCNEIRDFDETGVAASCVFEGAERIQDLSNEVERLRDALKKIAETAPNSTYNGMVMNQIAKCALEEQAK